MEPNANLLYMVSVFSLEPATETRTLSGSLGRIAPDGDLDWHVQVIQVRREPLRYSSGAALAVAYLRVEEHESPNVVEERDVHRAFELIDGLIATKEWRAGRPLRLHLVYAANYRGDGRTLGGSVYSNIIWGTGGGALGRDAIDPALLEQHPELGRAIRFFVRGIAAVDERFLPDALINYARSIECIVGSEKHPNELERECARLQIDREAVRGLLGKTRGRYAIAHALDIVKGKRRKLKELPSPEAERDARRLTEEVIKAFIRKLPPVDPSEELLKGVRYFGLPPVGTNLPLPREVLWSHRGPWDQAAPGMAPDWDPLPVVARRYRIRPEQLRRLVRRRRINGYKDGSRWQVSSVSAELYEALLAESSKDFQGSVFVRIRDAAGDTGVSSEELRDLVRRRELPGYFKSRFGMRNMVDVQSVRYLAWRRRRRAVVKQLYGRRNLVFDA